MVGRVEPVAVVNVERGVGMSGIFNTMSIDKKLTKCVLMSRKITTCPRKKLKLDLDSPTVGSISN